MSQDRTTITRAEAIRKRREEEQKRREILVKKTITAPKPAPVKAKANQTLRSKPAPTILGSKMGGRALPRGGATGLHSRRYDIAMSAPYGRTAAGGQTASLTIPKVTAGPRWISFLLVVLCGVALYFITVDSYFMVSSASVIGNKRVSAKEISSALGVMGASAALLNPAQIEYNILATFPDIATAQVEVTLPAEIVVTVSERQPIAAWLQDDQTTWVDGQGYAFPPRGLVEGLVTIAAVGAPPAPATPLIPPISSPGTFGVGVQNGGTGAAQGGIGARPFISPEMAAALMTISPRVPAGSTLVYDPRYGLGWADPRGWQAYFGHTDGDVNAKIQVYESMVDYLIGQNITPRLISVEYLDAPFYRTE